MLKTITPNDFGAVLEDINDKFTVMVEGLTILGEEFHEFKDEMTGFKEEMIGFKHEMTDFKGEMRSFREETRSNFTTVLNTSRVSTMNWPI